ncbi:hypothetical protein MKZ38_009332 [Zalerion maritima]|uniref:Uncharacterized protein n=1 Tax=Zalerion maritima TaxID=339359 RepID=A0AAD5WM40_9PEZI|nr:hypothetical protein MKZ38_009332 [Zalerion maritima]
MYQFKKHQRKVDNADDGATGGAFFETKQDITEGSLFSCSPPRHPINGRDQGKAGRIMGSSWQSRERHGVALVVKADLAVLDICMAPEGFSSETGRKTGWSGIKTRKRGWSRKKRKVDTRENKDREIEER